jgi:DDE superfamily endonuclease
VVFDAGYDLTRLAWLLAGLPVEVPGRLRSDRVMYFPAPPRLPGANGRPARHGGAFKLAGKRSWPAPAGATVTQTTRHGTARAAAWGRLHQQLASRAGWEDHHGELPVVEGTLIRLQVDHLPGDRSPEPVWLWSSRARTSAAEVDRAWQAFLRRFDIEHTFRFFGQALGWARPRLRDPAAADRWTWLVTACHAQLRLARHHRRPAAALAPALPARPADPRQRPPRVPQHPPGTPRSGQRAETRQTRPRTAARIDQPAPGHQPRRGKNRQAR